jgi:predicted ATPase
MHTLSWMIVLHILCGCYATAGAMVDELVALADEKGTSFWKAWGMMNQGWLFALTGKPADAVRTITSGISAWHSTGATMCVPFYSSCLATAYAQLGQFEEAHCAIRDSITAIEKTKERWFEAELHRVMGEIALKLPNLGIAEAERCFERALSVSQTHRAKSWELRAAMSLSRVRRDRDRPDVVRGLLAPIYVWFSEGFDTLDLTQARGLLDDLVR